MANEECHIASEGIPVGVILNQQDFYKSGEDMMHFRVPGAKKH